MKGLSISYFSFIIFLHSSLSKGIYFLSAAKGVTNTLLSSIGKNLNISCFEYSDTVIIPLLASAI